MANSSVVGLLRVLFTADTAQFQAGLRDVQTAAGKWQKDLGNIGRQATALGSQLTRTLTLPMAAVGAAAAKAAIDFESSFAGVVKTVDGISDEFGKLNADGRKLAQGFRDLSKEIPINVNELNRIGEAAGQLGIKRENIVAFTKVMAELSETTNLTAEQAAMDLARLANITQMPQENFDRLGASIALLGNKLETTESEIVDFGLRIAGAGKLAGLSEHQILGIGAAMSSVGIEAEAGGTAVQKVLNQMTEAVATGNKDLAAFAKTAGMSAQDFATAFRTDAAGAFSSFVTGLGEQGDQAFATLNNLGLGNERVIRAFLSLSGAGDKLNESLGLAAKGWRENTALTEEAQKRFATTESQMTLLWNRFKDIGITLGTAMLPALSALAGALTTLAPLIEGVAHGFAAMPDWMQATILASAAVVTALGPLLFGIGQLISLGSAVAGAFASGGIIAKALAFFGTSLPAIGASVAGFGTTLVALATGPIGIAVAAIAGLTTVWLLWGDEITALVKRVYGVVKTWLLDHFGPIFTSIGELLSSVGEMFSAFGALVGAIVKKVVGYAAETFAGVKTYLWDRLKPVLEPVGKLFSGIATVVGAVKDKVVEFARLIYEGVKLYLITRFTSIVDGIRSKIEAVTEFFRRMHDAVVGNSYVPDMVDGIGHHFGRLGSLMVDPALAATRMVSRLFQDLARSVGDAMGDLITGQMSVKDALLSIWQSIRNSLQRIFSNIVEDFINGLLGRMLGAITGTPGAAIGPALGGLFGGFGQAGATGAFVDSAVGGVGAGLGGGGGAGAGGLLGGLGAGALGLAIGYGIFKGFFDNPHRPWDALTGQEEAGKFFEQFGGEDNFRKFLESLGFAADEIDGLVAPLKDEIVLGIRSSFDAAIAEIRDAIRGAGIDITDAGFSVPHLASGGIVHQPTLAVFGEAGPEAVIPLERLDEFGIGHGSGAAAQPLTVNATFNISTIDGKGVKEFVESRDFAESLIQSIQFNTLGLGSAIRGVV